jgi:hypothetical protein
MKTKKVTKLKRRTTRTHHKSNIDDKNDGTLNCEGCGREITNCSTHSDSVVCPHCVIEQLEKENGNTVIFMRNL